jgi:hypothetical protein
MCSKAAFLMALSALLMYAVISMCYLHKVHKMVCIMRLHPFNCFSFETVVQILIKFGIGVYCKSC